MAIAMDKEMMIEMLMEQLPYSLKNEFGEIEVTKQHVTGPREYEGIVIHPADINVGVVLNIDNFYEEKTNLKAHLK